MGFGTDYTGVGVGGNWNGLTVLGCSMCYRVLYEMLLSAMASGEVCRTITLLIFSLDSPEYNNGLGNLFSDNP